MNARITLAAVLFGVAACSAESPAPPDAGYGPAPTLPPPRTSLVPTVQIAPAVRWAPGETPLAAPSFRVAEFASGLDHPRWLYVLPNGDTLVAESQRPAEGLGGVRGWVMKQVMRRAGSGGPSADRITLLRDMDADGVVETRSLFLDGLRSPIGMALIGGDFYVANTDAVWRFPYVQGATAISGGGEKVADLPAGAINYHWTKNLLASPDGTTLFVAVGSNSNIGEHGPDAEANRAAVLAVDVESRRVRVFASGLRNPVGLAWHPETGALWTTVNERDELGNDLVPDYLTTVRDGGFYGWPYSYFGTHVDARVTPQRPDLVAQAIVPDYALGAHTASLGLAFSTGALFGPGFRGGAFIGQHGSWNRRPRSGYAVIFVPFANGMPAGPPEPVLTGFVNAGGQARGRPAGVAIDRVGALLVADDVGNRVWRVTPETRRALGHARD
jgi:glucose/arabinose dehydrogenase